MEPKGYLFEMVVLYASLLWIGSDDKLGEIFADLPLSQPEK
jgi:hypothetical protein